MNNNFAEIGKNHFSIEEPPSATADSITIMSVFLAVLKRPWIILVSLLIVIGPLSYYLLNISTVYQSTSTVMISVRESSFLDAVSLVEGRRPDVKSEKYYTSILDSWAYRDDVVDQIIGLNPHMPRDSVESIVRSSIGYSISRREPGFMNVFATSQSKKFALLLAETALEEFQTRSIKLEREDALHISEFISDQVKNITKKLEQAEEDLQTFLSEKKLLMVGIGAGITQELFDLELKNNEAKASLEMISININSYDQQMNELLNKLTDDSQAVNENKIFLLKDRLAEIRKTLNDSRALNLSQADVQVLMVERDKLRNELINQVTPASSDGNNGVSNVGVTLQRLEQELEAALLTQTKYANEVQFYKLQIQRFRSDHPKLSEDILTFASLSRAKEVLQKTLDILLEKREEVRIRVESEMGGIKVIDAPRLPDQPLTQNRRQKLLIGILASIAMGVVFTIILDRFDNTINDENDIHSLFRLSVFGTIPALDSDSYRERSGRHRDRKSEKIEVNEESKYPALTQKLLKNYSEKSPTAEAYRSLKIAVQFLATDQSKKVFVLSSPSVSEGKSLTTANLAISFAQGGNKTLIIDCDLRKTVQHKYFELERKPGLTNHLYGEVELEEVIRDTGIKNLFIITSGSSPSNPAELLASQKMKKLLLKLRSQFDYIIIDTPPVLVCSDSRILAEYVDGMIMLVKVESTNVKALDHALNLTKQLNINVLGVILNQVEFRFGRAYYYTYRYYRPYSYYSGYYYKRQYYDYTESETGEKIRTPRTGKGIRKRRSQSKKA